MSWRPISWSWWKGLTALRNSDSSSMKTSMGNGIQVILLGRIIAEEKLEERSRKEIKLESEDPIGRLLKHVTRLFR